MKKMKKMNLCSHQLGVEMREESFELTPGYSPTGIFRSGSSLARIQQSPHRHSHIYPGRVHTPDTTFHAGAANGAGWQLAQDRLFHQFPILTTIMVGCNLAFPTVFRLRVVHVAQMKRQLQLQGCRSYLFGR